MSNLQRQIEGPRDRERIATVVVPDPDDLTIYLADRIAHRITQDVSAKGRCVLGLATGSTPISIYRELIRRHDAGELDFGGVITFNLDEYYPMLPENIHSYHRYMWENLFSHVNIDPANVHIPDGTVARDDVDRYCAEYESRIAEAGGIDFQLLGIGRSGHIGFNEPGSSLTSRTHLTTLDRITRMDAAADFFGEHNVPREALTMGVATILEAREIALVATGEHKAAIVKRTVQGKPSADVSATHLQRHDGATVYLDLAAAGHLTRIATPWVLESVDWDERMIDRAVVWLSERTEKAILKLIPSDYQENHLSPLLAVHRSAGEVNGAVFNRLGSKIRGRSKLAAKKRVLVFSPHPDDDVISMGGILKKLCENENAITVAYMTTGNIAVHDHDVVRHVDFLLRSATTLGIDVTNITQAKVEIEAEFDDKVPGDVDSIRVQNLKRYIRESEAVAGLETLGVTPSSARFLDLPFYRTGEVRKRPIGEEDVECVRQLVEEVRPDLIFVAGDLSDPHGTHRMCKAAIDRAVERYEAQPSPEIWYYRGAWQEWSITEADVLVPLSQEELRTKILAIFKHQSQKDTAPFPGGVDDREFWQRVEDRNLATAACADRLGLAEYCAMEAFVLGTPGSPM